MGRPSVKPCSRWLNVKIKSVRLLSVKFLAFFSKSFYVCFVDIVNNVVFNMRDLE